MLRLKDIPGNGDPLIRPSLSTQAGEKIAVKITAVGNSFKLTRTRITVSDHGQVGTHQVLIRDHLERRNVWTTI